MLKSLFVILFFTINSLCHALKIECSICHEQFEREKASGTICTDCKELIKAVKVWKQGCSECRRYAWLDLCPDCLKDIKKQEGTCNNRHHELYNICIKCLEVACQAKENYDNENNPNCLIKGCKSPIDPKGCCGYPTGLCTDHNASLRQAIKKHKANCKATCRNYPFLDICPECIDSINAQKNKHEECIWSSTPYDVYVPCETCLLCYSCQ